MNLLEITTPTEQLALQHVAYVGSLPQSVSVTRETVKPNDIVWVHSRGQWRQTIVEKVGTKRVSIVYTTQGSLNDYARHGWTPTFTRKSVAFKDAQRPL